MLQKIGVTLALCSALVGCSTTSGKQIYGLRFLIDQSEGVDLLDWNYSLHGKTIEHAPRPLLNQGHVARGDSMTGFMPIGDRLCVKWRDVVGGIEHSECADLRGLIPEDMGDKALSFDIKRGRLYVYIATTVLRPAGVAANGPKLFQPYIVYTIYPISEGK